MTRRLIVRRTRLTDRAQQRLWPDWRHHAFLTDLDGDAVDVDAFHRRHAVVELAIRDLKEGAGLDHVPSGNFHANGAWLQCAVLAHNLIRWTATLGDVRVDDELIVARTVRTRLIASPPDSSTAPADPPSDCPNAGHGQTPSPPPSPHSACCDPSPSERCVAVRRAALTPSALTTPNARTADTPRAHQPVDPAPTQQHRANRLTGQIGGSRFSPVERRQSSSLPTSPSCSESGPTGRFVQFGDPLR